MAEKEIKYYTVTQYAKLMSVDRTTVYRWIRDGQLATVEVAKGVKRIRIVEEK